MEMEADRMVNLLLEDEEVLTERKVILEERRERTENEPVGHPRRADGCGALSCPIPTACR